MKIRKINFFSKIEYVGFSVFLFLLTLLIMPSLTDYKKSLFKITPTKDTLSIQKLVDQYYYDKVEFPSKFQPSIGFPAEINMSLLGKFDLDNKNTYMVDAYGKVYVLNDGFMPPKQVELLVDKDNNHYIKWTGVPQATAYGIKMTTNPNTELMDKAFGRITASLVSVTAKGNILYEDKIENFTQNSDGTYQFKVDDYDPKAIYTIYSINEKIGITPDVSIGYIKK